MEKYLDTIIGGIIGLIGVILGFSLQLFSDKLAERKRIKEEFAEIRNGIYSVTIANNLFPELLKLKRFFIRYDSFMKNNGEDPYEPTTPGNPDKLIPNTYPRPALGSTAPFKNPRPRNIGKQLDLLRSRLCWTRDSVLPEWVCSVHGDIAGSLFPDWGGRLRDINVMVGTHTPPPYYEVPVHIRLYCEDLSARLMNAEGGSIEAIAETLAYADWRFQWIHPFKDFNGRVGRILLAAVLFRLKLPPAETAAVEPEAKARYLEALRAADEGDLSPLTEIWGERLSAAAEGAE